MIALTILIALSSFATALLPVSRGAKPLQHVPITLKHRAHTTKGGRFQSAVEMVETHRTFRSPALTELLRDIRALPRDKEEERMELQAWEEWKQDKDTQTSLAAIHHLFGIEESDFYDISRVRGVRFSLHDWWPQMELKRRLLTWKDVQREKAVFVRFQGGFDLTRVLVDNEIVAGARWTIENNEAFDYGPYFLSGDVWFRSVWETRCLGYFPNAFEGTRTRTKARHFVNQAFQPEHYLFPHLMHYRTFWNDADNVLLLDELYACSDLMPPNITDVPPLQLLKHVRRKRHQAEWRNRFRYLDTLPDEGNMCILRTPQEILEVGKAMHNCLEEDIFHPYYQKECEEKQSVCVSLVDDDGNVVAVGVHGLGYLFYSKTDAGYHGWDEIEEHRGMVPSEETLRSFRDYSITLEEWNKELLPESRRRWASIHGFD